DAAGEVDARDDPAFTIRMPDALAVLLGRVHRLVALGQPRQRDEHRPVVPALDGLQRRQAVGGETEAAAEADAVIASVHLRQPEAGAVLLTGASAELAARHAVFVVQITAALDAIDLLPAALAEREDGLDPADRVEPVDAPHREALVAGDDLRVFAVEHLARAAHQGRVVLPLVLARGERAVSDRAADEGVADGHLQAPDPRSAVAVALRARVHVLAAPLVAVDHEVAPAGVGVDPRLLRDARRRVARVLGVLIYVVLGMTLLPDRVVVRARHRLRHTAAGADRGVACRLVRAAVVQPGGA